MSLLLQLPRELRDEILAMVAFTSATPPESPEALRRDGIRCPVLGVRGTIGGLPQLDLSSVICVPSGPYGPVNTTLALLLTNRQLHAETHALLNIRPESRICEVDVMDTDFYGPRLWVTWLCVPCKRVDLDALIVNIRLFDELPVGQSVDDASARKRFLCASMSQTYRFLLASILQTGPGSNVVTRLDYEASFFVRRLVFRFQHPRWVTDPGPRPESTLRLAPDIAYASAGGLHQWLSGFQLGEHDFQDGRIMLQGVGEMEVRVGDELILEPINVTDAFCRLPNPDTLWPLNLFEHRWEFDAWVHGTMDRRKRWGMWDETVQARLIDEGEPECGLLIPGLWWNLIGDDWRTVAQLPVGRRAYPFNTVRDGGLGGI